MVSLIATKVELAFGANLTADPSTWTWTDVSTFALGSVTVRAGRADEASQTQPTQCTFRLANTDARFTPRFPTSPYYPNVRRQTPVRVSLNPGTGVYAQRFQGYIDAITPTWPSGNSTVAEVSVVASGITRRLGQGHAQLHSALYRAITTSSVQPTAYWPCEDRADRVTVTQAVSPIAGVPSMLATGASNFAATTGAPGSDMQPNFNAGGYLTGVVPGTSAVTSWRVQCLVQLNTITAPSFASPIQWDTTDGNSWELLANPVGSGGFGYSDTLGNAFNSGVQIDNGQWHEVRATQTQSGGNIVLNVFLDGVLVINQTFVGTVSRVVKVYSNLAGNGQSIMSGVGHFVVWNGAISTPGLDSVLAMNGNAGETPTARMTRLCAENSVQLSITGTSSDPMGPQRVDTLNNLLRECEAVDGGILYDGSGAGLSYFARSSRYNQAASLALDCNRYQVKLPFAPVEDDQRIRNDWTITRPNGSSISGHFADPVHIAANGLYNDSATVNLQSDSQTVDQAAWRVHRDTADEMRIPTLTFDPLHSPELQTQWFATTVGERLTVTNLPSQYPYSSTDQIVEGYAESWDSVTWSVTLNLFPYRPWEVFQIQDARLGRIETDGSTLNSSTTTSGTSLSVASAGVVWDTAATPFDIEIEAEQITVTAVTGSSSPQTFTVTRAVNGVVKAHNSAVTVKLWKPGVLAL